MGTGFDYFAQEAHAGNEQSMVRNGVISMEAYRNRMLLYYVTSCNGMLPYEYEWWHFQIEQNEEDKLKHRLLEF